MTLFWHNHFVSSQQKVRLARLMYAQNATLRAQRARQLRRRCCTPRRSDPAMLIYLDSVQNRKGAAQRELRARGDGALHARRRPLHRAGRQGGGARLHRLEPRPRRRRLRRSGRACTTTARRRCFGQRGRFDGDDVLDILLARPETARFVVGKLWREFVSPDPDPREVERIARRLPRVALRHQGGAARAAHRSPRSGRPTTAARWSKSRSSSWSARCGSSTCARRCGCRLRSPRAAWARTCSRRPTSRAGPAARRWINSSTLLARKQFLDALARPARPTAMDDARARDRCDGVRANGRRRRRGRAVGCAMRRDALRRLRAARSVERASRAAVRRAAWLGASPAATSGAHSQRRSAAAAAAAGDADVAEARASATRSLFVRAALLDPVVPAQVRSAMDRRRFLRPRSARSPRGRSRHPPARSPRRMRSPQPRRDTGLRPAARAVELKGGNDGLNTWCRTPIRAYYALRPKLAIARDRSCSSPTARAASGARAAAPACGRRASSPCCRAWAIPAPNLSHFRSIEIWDTASQRATSTCRTAGSRARSRARRRRATSRPTAWSSARTTWVRSPAAARARIALANTEQFLRRARLAQRRDAARQQGARAHPEGRRRHRAGRGAPRAATHVRDRVSGDGRSATRSRTACQIVANPAGVAWCASR